MVDAAVMGTGPARIWMLAEAVGPVATERRRAPVLAVFSPIPERSGYEVVIWSIAIATAGTAAPRLRRAGKRSLKANYRENEDRESAPHPIGVAGCR
jgi:hypothetical protein